MTVLPKNMETSAAVRAGTVATEWGSGNRIKVRSLHFCFAKKRPGGLVKPSICTKASSRSWSPHCSHASKTAWTEAGRVSVRFGQRCLAVTAKLVHVDRHAAQPLSLPPGITTCEEKWLTRDPTDGRQKTNCQKF